MRRREYEMPRTEALELLAAAPFVHLAAAAPDGAPLLRTLHGTVVDGAIAFHGSPAGEKTLAAGQVAVVSAEEIVARVPSYFVHPERACPATTYYRSVHARGAVEDVADPDRKARILQAMMERYQPEGGHAPVRADAELYRAAVRGLWVFQVRLAHVTGKAKLGQNRSPSELEAVLGAIWRRGHAGDPRAIDLVRRANPAAADPAALAGPPGVRLWVAPGADDAAQIAALLRDTYWNEGVDPEALRAAHLGATAWVVARDAAGRVVGSARALSDGAKNAWVYDVVVAADWRGRGVGKAVVRVLLDHPAVRGARTVMLGTRDAQGLYRQFGFVDRADLPPRPYRSTEMALVRDSRAGAHLDRSAAQPVP